MNSILSGASLCLALLFFAPSAQARTDTMPDGAIVDSTANITPDAMEEYTRVLQKAGWEKLTARLVDDGFDATYIMPLYARLGTHYSPDPMAQKITALYRKKFAPPQKKTPPSKKSKAPTVYPGIITDANIEKATAFMKEHNAVLRAAEARFGIPPEVSTGLLFVETRLGEFLGSVAALHNLSSLAASDLESIAPVLRGLDLKSAQKRQWTTKRTQQKAQWAYTELKALLTWTKEHSLDPTIIPGSIYGAVGICQFMPSNIALFGEDGDDNGIIDLFQVPDAIFSMSRYLKEHGWKKNLDRKKQHRVLMRYNHSTVYANTILQLADALTPDTTTP